jgi:hypothetical protein
VTTVMFVRGKANKSDYQAQNQTNYDGVSKSFRTESIIKYMLTFGIAR